MFEVPETIRRATVWVCRPVMEKVLCDFSPSLTLVPKVYYFQHSKNPSGTTSGTGRPLCRRLRLLPARSQITVLRTFLGGGAMAMAW